MSELKSKQCKACKGDEPAIQGDELKTYLDQIQGWHVESEHHIQKEFQFKNFKESMAFVNKVGDLAESQGHHPDIFISWNKVLLQIWTHKIDALTENDFILAAKIDEI